MSDRAAVASPEVEADVARSDGRMVPTIRIRDDVEGCGCLDCLGLDAAAIRRTVLDTLLWSVRLCRTYPSIPAFALAPILARRLATVLSSKYLPVPLLELLELLVPFGLWIVLRAYVAAVAAADLTGHEVSPRAGLRYGLERSLALVAVVCASVTIALFAFSAASTPVFALLVVALFAGVNPMTTVGIEVVAVVAFGLPLLLFLYVLFKFWFAMEACIVGRYGPLESLRVSWRITTSLRTKFLLVLVSSVGSVGVVAFLGFLPGTDGALFGHGPALTAIGTIAGEFLSVVWCGAYAHLYVQGAVEG